MNRLAAHALAALVVAVVAVAAAAAWYYGTGWKAFSFAQAAGSAAPSWTPVGGSGADPAAADRLRFRKAVFTVTTASGATHAADVTAVLNGMAVAYRGSPTAPAALVLARPLNPYSFAIAGVNDPSVTGSATSDPLTGASATLAGYYRTV